jgi:hypothetical protein
VIDAPEALGVDVAGKQRVDADAVGPELDGEALGEADDAPLRCRIGAAQRVAQPSGNRREIDDRPAAGCPQQRHGLRRAGELTFHVDGERALQRVGGDVLDAGRR